MGFPGFARRRHLPDAREHWGYLRVAGRNRLHSWIAEECRSIAAAEGYPVREAQLNRTRKTLTAAGSTLTASMLRDIERNAPIEADHIVGDLLRRGAASSQHLRTDRLHPPESLRGPAGPHTPTSVVWRVRSTNLEGAPSYSRTLRIGWVIGDHQSDHKD